uniref:Uncharacterized protein n=1 Tax=Panagrolaimus sp. ES5 TaxID=591445 RepID=A0AC34GUD0_9BILA
MKFLYIFALFCLLLRQSYGVRDRLNKKYVLFRVVDDDYSVNSDSSSEEDFLGKSKLWKALRSRRSHRDEPTYDMIGSFGTILWEPKPKPLEKKLLKGYVDDC